MVKRMMSFSGGKAMQEKLQNERISIKKEAL